MAGARVHALAGRPDARGGALTERSLALGELFAFSTEACTLDEAGGLRHSSRLWSIYWSRFARSATVARRARFWASVTDEYVF